MKERGARASPTGILTRGGASLSISVKYRGARAFPTGILTRGGAVSTSVKYRGGRASPTGILTFKGALSTSVKGALATSVKYRGRRGSASGRGSGGLGHGRRRHEGRGARAVGRDRAEVGQDGGVPAAPSGAHLDGIQGGASRMSYIA